MPEPIARELPETVTRPLTQEAEAVISEVVQEAGPAPLPPAAKEQRDGQVELRAAAALEYVAGGPGHSALAYAQSLPPWIDDVSRDFGADLYERMLLDAHVAGEVMSYKLSVLANGVRLLPAVENSRDDVEQQRKHRIAADIAAFCQAALDEMETDLMEVLDDMLEAFALGHRVAEVVWRFDGSYLVPERLMVKDRHTYAFVVSSRGKLIGILAALAGHTSHVVRPHLVVDPAKTPNLLPPAKFARLTWRPRLADPRGTSALRPAYDPWWQKRQTAVELAKYIVQFAGAGIVATLAEKAVPQPRRSADGSVARDEQGVPIMDHPAELLLQNLQQWKNGSAMVVPFGTVVENLVADGAGAPFFQQLERLDKQITKAILGQTLATNEAEHDTRAASEGHKDVLDVLVSFGERACCAMLRRLLKTLVQLNYGPDWLWAVPQVSLSAAEEADVPELMGAFAGVGYQIDAIHLPEMDAKLGLPPRDPQNMRSPVPPAPADPNEKENPDAQ